MRKIPILNVYYLLCYAWDQMAEGELVSVADLKGRRVEELLGAVLARGTARLLRIGLARSYVEREESIPGIRGRLDIARSLRQMDFQRGHAACRFDELDRDVLHNQILRGTLRSLLRLADLDANVRSEVRRAFSRMEGVSDLKVRREHFARVQLHANNRFYRFLLGVCRIIHDNLLPSEQEGTLRFRDFLEDEAQMWRIFERFVFHFYRRHSEYRVHAPHIQWFEATGTDAALARLPQMRTDVVLESSERRLVIDTKFYKESLQGRFGAETFQSSNLYQLFTYVQNAQAADTARPVDGMLLYPVVSQNFSFDVTVMGRPLRLSTVNLDQDWMGIHEEMLALLGPFT